MQTAYGLQFGAWLLLWLCAFAYIKLHFPDSAPGKVLATIS
jgi:hypothetical protein